MDGVEEWYLGVSPFEPVIMIMDGFYVLYLFSLLLNEFESDFKNVLVLLKIDHDDKIVVKSRA